MRENSFSLIIIDSRGVRNIDLGEYNKETVLIGRNELCLADRDNLSVLYLDIVEHNLIVDIEQSLGLTRKREKSSRLRVVYHNSVLVSRYGLILSYRDL